MQVVKLEADDSIESALAVLKKLEEDLTSGKIVGFFAAGVGPNDETYAYTGSRRKVSRLRLGGAMQYALFAFNEGEEL